MREGVVYEEKKKIYSGFHCNVTILHTISILQTSNPFAMEELDDQCNWESLVMKAVVTHLASPLTLRYKSYHALSKMCQYQMKVKGDTLSVLFQPCVVIMWMVYPKCMHIEHDEKYSLSAICRYLDEFHFPDEHGKTPKDIERREAYANHLTSRSFQLKHLLFHGWSWV